ncbi:MAG: LD-carboxypeptidase [Clostridiales bacterium]|nr:LD-carboxypeptidase [Clostridiales bacterium]
MFYPKFLEKGNCIGVPAPSSGAYNELYMKKYENAIKKLKGIGYKTAVSENIKNSLMAKSASAQERAKELNKMMESTNIDLIICAAGGEFLVEILPYVDFEKLVKNPKFIQGFSDPTGILFPITTKYDIATIYGNNFGDYGVEEYDRSVIDSLEILKGNLVEQENYEMYEGERIEDVTGLEGYNFTTAVEWKSLDEKNVEISGRIIGGCLDIIAEIAGTKYDGMKDFNEKYKEDGIILYFDNCELSQEELIRTMWKLNEFDYFKYVKGIVFGRNGVETSCLGYTMDKALKDSVLSNLNIPILYDTDISHKGPCLTIINGAIANIKYSNGKGSINFELK